MKTILLSSLFFLFILLSTAFSQISRDTLNVNNISAIFKANGSHFYTTGSSPDFEFPKNSGKSPLSFLGLWISGRTILGQNLVSAPLYDLAGNEYLPGLIANDTNYNLLHFNKIWKITRSQIQYHLANSGIPGYIPPTSITTWPVHNFANGITPLPQLAPFVDINNDSVYNPLTGDYPQMFGDEMLYYIFNDNTLHPQTQSSPMGLEIEGFAWAYNTPSDSALWNTIFMKYVVHNRSTSTYVNTYFSLFTDFNIGYAFDDYIGCDVQRSTFYGYNATPIDHGSSSISYDSLPVAQGITILQGPLMDPDFHDNPFMDYSQKRICDESVNGSKFGDSIIDNECFGLTGFKYYTSPQGYYPTNPLSTSQIINYMQNISVNPAFTYGGDGSNPSNVSARFMFPGNSDTLNWGTNCTAPPNQTNWTELTAGNLPGDRKCIETMGPLVLKPGQHIEINLALISARASNYFQDPIPILLERVDKIKLFYKNNPGNFTIQPLAISNPKPSPIINTYPNPAQNKLWIKGLDKFSKVSYRIVNIIGEIIETGQLQNYEPISLVNLKTGLYFIQLIIDDQKYTTKFIKY